MPPSLFSFDFVVGDSYLCGGSDHIQAKSLDDSDGRWTNMVGSNGVGKLQISKQLQIVSYYLVIRSNWSPETRESIVWKLGGERNDPPCAYNTETTFRAN